MRIKNLFTLLWVFAALVTLGTGTSRAATLSFSFSFINYYDGGTVTGIVRGLTDNSTSAATSVEILTNPYNYGIGEFVGHPVSNSWTVANGQITVFSFLSNGNSNSSPDVTTANLGLGILNIGPIAKLFVGGLNPDPDGGVTKSRASALRLSLIHI